MRFLLLLWIAAVTVCIPSSAQDAYVFVNTNGVVQFPVNLWAANSNDIVQAIGGAFPGGSGSRLVVNGTEYPNPVFTNTPSVTISTNGNGHLEFAATGTSAWVAKPAGATALWTFGDSITAGSSATDRSNRWPTLLAGRLGLSVSNVAYGGAVIADINGQILPGFTWTNAPYGDPQVWSPSAISTSTVSALLTGFNDLRYRGTNLVDLAAYSGGLAHALAYLAIPSDRIIKAQSATTSGSWSSLSWHGGALGRQSSSAGATLTFTNLVGPVLYLAYENAANSTNGGSFTVTIDGVTATASTVSATTAVGNRGYEDGADYVPYTGGPYGNGRIDCIPTLLRYGGVGPGQHTVVVTVASAATGPVRILWAAVPVVPQPGDRSGPWVYCGAPTAQATWNISGSNQAHSQYAEVVRQVVARLAADGLRVRFVPTDVTFDRYTMIDADTVHPNDAGHVRITDTFYQQMLEDSSPFGTLADTQSKSSGLFTEFGVTSLRPSASKFGSSPNWTNSSVTISYAEAALDRHLFLGGNYIRSETKAGVAQNMALAAAGANVILQGGSGYGLQYGSGGPVDTFGSGSPEGVSPLAYGSTWRRTDTGQLYVKKSASGVSTGWVDATAAGSGTSIGINGTTVSNPVFTNSTTATLATNANGHIEITVVGGGGGGGTNAVSKELRSWDALSFMPPSIGTNAALWAPRGNGVPAVSFAGNFPRTASVLLKVPQGHNLSGGLQLVLDACSTTAISTSNVVMQAQYQLLSPAAATVDTASYSGAVLITNVFPGVVGVATNLTFNCPSWVFTAGQLYQIEFKRVTDSASDTNDASAVVVFNAQANTID